MGKLARRNSQQKAKYMEEITQAQLDAMMQELITKYTCFSGWYLKNEPAGLGPLTMLKEIYAQTAFNHAGVVATLALITEKLEIPQIEISKRIALFLDMRLGDMEKQYRIKVTQEECYSVDEHGNKIPDEPESEGKVQ